MDIDTYYHVFNEWLYVRYGAAPLILLVFSRAPKSPDYNRRYRIYAVVMITAVSIALASIRNCDLLVDVYEQRLVEKDIALTKDAATTLHNCQWKVSYPYPNLYIHAIINWFFAFAYAGIWELLWRIRHRTTIATLATPFTGKRLSTGVIIYAIISHIWYVYTKYIRHL